MGGKCLKWVSPGNDGVPDRIVIVPGIGVHFVELKASCGRASAKQLWWRKWFHKAGVPCDILIGREDVERWCDSIEEKLRGGDDK